MKRLHYWAGYASGWLAMARKRATPGYVAGYLAGMWERLIGSATADR